MTAAPRLETTGLTKKFDGVTAVDDVDFRVSARELRCLIGPNGAGKSTFFGCLSGQLVPSSGRVRFGGEDITGAAAHAIAQMGVSVKTQVPALFDELSVIENLWLAAWPSGHRVARARKVDEVLATIGLAELANRTAGSLVHGQRQWLELGLVMAGDPRLMLLDEPTAGMTRQEVVRTARLLRTLAQDRAVIVVEHDLQFVRMVADSVTVLHRGRILAEGSAQTVLEDVRVREVYLGRISVHPSC